MLYPNLNPLYITSNAIDPPFIDKTTALPLQNGKVWFWRDADRTVPKPVFELTGTAPNYSFQELPNPMSLGPNGCFIDANGNDVAVYYYPWDDQSPANLDLYYIQVYNSQGIFQCDRQAWPYPNLAEEEQGQETGPTSLSNTILNSQFAFLYFDPASGSLTINVTAGNNQVFNFAPGWNLLLNATGTGSVTLTQNQPKGQFNYPGQPPTTLSVTSTGGVTFLAIEQVLTGNPNIFAQDDLGFGGFVNTSILLSPNTTVTVLYVPNGGATNYPVLLSASNIVSGLWETFSNTVALPQGQNPLSNPNGSTAIQIVLTPGTSNQEFSCVQIVPTYSDVPNISYQEVPLIRQQGELFGIYQSALNYKPITSYLIGWDFPQNPAQFTNYTVAAAGGANTSFYALDQTIVFQSAASGVSISQDSGTKGLVVTGAAGGGSQFALIQYLSAVDARKILNSRLSANVSAVTNITNGIVGTITLWYTTNGSLPSISGANASLVTGLGATGVPTVVGGWSQVPRSLGNAAQFTILPSSTTNFNDYGFNEWDMKGIAAVDTATFFAIVVGFATLPHTNTVTFNSISLVPGDIPTRPAPQSDSAVFSDCQAYYWSNFPPGTVPAQNAGVFWETNGVASTGTNYATFFFPSVMNSVPSITTYNPSALNAQARNPSIPGDCTNTIAGDTTKKSTVISCTPNGAASAGEAWVVNLSADARLGK